MIEAVIFDLDGLLIDSEVISHKIYVEILKEYGIDFSKEEYAKNYSGKTEVVNVTNLIKTYNLPFSIEEGLSKVRSIENILIDKGVKLKKGAKNLLVYLQKNNFKIAVASSSVKKRALTILMQHNILDFFDALVFGHEVEKGKPSPDIFLKACDKLSSKPENCLVLEDSEAGIQAGYMANIPVICIPDMKMPSKEYIGMATLVLESLDDVTIYLNKQAGG